MTISPPYVQCGQTIDSSERAVPGYFSFQGAGIQPWGYSTVYIKVPKATSQMLPEVSGQMNVSGIDINSAL